MDASPSSPGVGRVCVCSGVCGSVRVPAALALVSVVGSPEPLTSLTPSLSPQAGCCSCL